MENVSPSTRANKRRRLASPQEDELETLPLSEAGPGWSLTGLVGRMLRAGVKDPRPQKRGVNGKSPTANKPMGNTSSLAAPKEQATATTTTLMNGGASVVAEEASRETGSDMEEQEEDGVTTPKRGRRGRPQGQNKKGNLARTADVGDIAAPTGDRPPVRRTSRRTTRSRADPSTNGAGTPKIARGMPARQKNVSVQSNARTTRRRVLESPDPLGEPIEMSPNSDSTDHGERAQPANGQSYDKAKSPEAMETGDNETAQLTNGSTLEQDQASEVMDIDGTEDSPPKPRSSGRQRKRPRRYSVEVEATEAAKQRRGTAELVSILTPSKRLKGGINGRKKSVAFQGPAVDFGEKQLGFTDIDLSKRADADHDDSVNGYENDDGGVEALANLSESELTGAAELGIHADVISMRGVSDVNSHMEDVDDLPQYARDFRKICQDHALESQLSVLSHIILEQLTSKRRIPLLGLDDAYLKVHQVVRQTVVAGEGNSMLILGARGTGKTALVETVISDLAKDYEDDFHVIRLNGFIHTDDRLALKEIWKQLGREMETGDEIAGNSISYADTLSSLLALLSHPEELSGEETDAAAKSVIFVMDEFDLFASHPRQTLLYNLFDISQARKAPIAVLGLSTKVDVSESLEKRVKSRFSHRYVHLPMSKNLKTFEAICKAGLEVQDTDKSRFGGDEGQMLLHGWSQLLKVCINLSNSKTWSVLLMPSGRVGAF
jgi:origin recognition complex subunit 4